MCIHKQKASQEPKAYGFNCIGSKVDRNTQAVMSTLNIIATSKTQALIRAAQEIWSKCGWDKVQRCEEHLFSNFEVYRR